jgi:hypothetical protein
VPVKSSTSTGRVTARRKPFSPARCPPSLPVTLRSSRPASPCAAALRRAAASSARHRQVRAADGQLEPAAVDALPRQQVIQGPENRHCA